MFTDFYNIWHRVCWDNLSWASAGVYGTFPAWHPRRNSRVGSDLESLGPVIQFTCNHSCMMLAMWALVSSCCKMKPWLPVWLPMLVNSSICSKDPFPSLIPHLSTKQVAQLWQRDHAVLASFSINVQLYSQKSQKCIFEPPYGGIRGNISAFSESFNANKLCSRVLSRDCRFYL